MPLTFVCSTIFFFTCPYEKIVGFISRVESLPLFLYMCLSSACYFHLDPQPRALLHLELQLEATYHTDEIWYGHNLRHLYICSIVIQRKQKGSFFFVKFNSNGCLSKGIWSWNKVETIVEAKEDKNIWGEKILKRVPHTQFYLFFSFLGL